MEGPTATTIVVELSEFCKVSHNLRLLAKLKSPLTEGGLVKVMASILPKLISFTRFVTWVSSLRKDLKPMLSRILVSFRSLVSEYLYTNTSIMLFLNLSSPSIKSREELPCQIIAIFFAATPILSKSFNTPADV